MRIICLLDVLVLQDNSSNTKTVLTNISHRLKMKMNNQISKFQEQKATVVNLAAAKQVPLK